MASARDTGKEEVISSTVPGAKGQSSTQSVVNTFANDGSFLELFKKRMEAESQKPQATQISVRKDDLEKNLGAECEEKQSEKKAVGPTKSLAQQGKRTFAVGKMGGSSKQMQAKKMKKEKEAVEAAKKAAEEAESKSSAWKAYMDEVQKYKEMSCSDDSERVRPLVK